MTNNLFILNKNKVVVDILSNNGTSPKSPFFNDLYVQYLETGAETYEFSTIANERTNVYCQTGSFVAFNYQDKIKMFQITETAESHEGNNIIKTCYCEMAGIELNNYAIRAMEMQSVNVVQFLEAVLSDTSWGIGNIDSSITDVLSIVIEKPTNVYTLLQEYLPKFNCELEFYTDIKNNRVAGQYINIYRSRGSETLKRFEYSEENVSNVTRQKDISQVATAMIGIGKDGLTFKNASWTSSDPAIKPKNQDFVVNPDAYEKWNKQGEHILGIYENTEVESEYELLRLTWEELKKVSDPKFNYEVETVMIQSDEDEISIGDTVYVIDHEYGSSGLFLEARIGQLEISFTDHTKNKCQLTNYKEVQSGIRKQLSESQINDLINSYFPIGSNKLQDGAITEGKIDKTYYSSIKTDIVQASVADVQVLIADKASIEDLNASNAKIENLIAEDVAISGKITAAEAEIEELKANDATITGKLTANEADIKKLKAEDVAISGKLTATEAEIKTLKSENVTVSGKLEATQADINILKSDIAEIDTLLAGNITAENIQAGSITANEIASGTITAGSGVIANGAIGSAQISELDAAKISAGTIDTSKVTVAGPNSNLIISGNRLQVFQGIGSKQVERVSLGDIQGDGTQYGFLVRGSDGKTVIMDENGVTNAGITNGSVTNDKINSNANIDGAKLNINSVVTKINGATESISGTKIDIEGTNLSAKLSNITTTQTDQEKNISENSSKITANEKAINLKVDSQTYKSDKEELETQLNKNTADIALNKDAIALKVEQADINNAKSELEGKIDTKVNAAKAEIKVTTDKISQNISNLTTTVSNKADGSSVTSLSNKVGSLETSVNGIKGQVSSLETTTTSIGSTATSALNKANQGVSDAAAAKTAADSKAKVFTSTPTVPYKVGDIWTAGPTGDLMKCKVARSSGSYTASDWEKASKYTDDSKANTANATANANKTEISNTKSKVSSIEANLSGITSRVGVVETKQTTIDGKVTNLETWKKEAELKITNDAIVSTVKASKNTDGKNTFAQQSDITQLNNSWTAKFNDGYNQGITTINKDGIKVTQSNINGYANMTANGFYLNKGGEDVFKVDNNGAYFKGSVTITSGSVPDSAISSTLKNSITTAQSTANTAKTNAATAQTSANNAQSTANTAKSTADNSWSRIGSWTYPNTTVINGGKIQTGSITANQIAANAITADKLHANAINGKTITGATLKGGSFFTAPSQTETDGHAFRIYSDGRVFSKKTIQVYGSKEDGDYSQLEPHRLTTTGYVQSSGYKTDNMTMFFAVDGAAVDKPTGNNNRRIKLTRNSEGNTYFAPDYPSTSSSSGIRLGTQNYMWNILYSKNGTSSSSDRNLKENIHYISNDMPNKRAFIEIEDLIAQRDLYNFVRDDLCMAQFNFIGDDETTVGFIAQDLLYDKDGSDNKIGQMIVNLPDEEQAPLTYNEKTYTNVLAGALREAILKIEVLEDKIQVLENKTMSK